MKRCPKCRSKAITVYEIAQVGIPLRQTVGGNWRRQLSTPEEYVTGYEGLCRDCRHEWRFRRDPTSDGRRWWEGEETASDPDVREGA